ncbi:hypothetical protein ACLEXA_02265 [Pseudescherichia vulneris]
MIKGLQLRKNTKPMSRTKIVGIVILIISLLTTAGSGGWYYFVHKPALAVSEMKRQQDEQLSRDIKEVDDFYLTSLSGGSIQSLISLLTEIVASYELLNKFSYTNETFVCDSRTCSFNYQLGKNGTFSVIQKRFWGESYSSNFSTKGFDFTGIKSGLNNNDVLVQYKKKNNNGLKYPCGDVLSYIYSWNTIMAREWEIKIDSPPSSKVLAKEKALALKGRATLFKFNFIKWSMKFPKLDPKDNSKLLYLASLFGRQAYSDAFIVQKIDSVKAKKISGVIVCKSGI